MKIVASKPSEIELKDIPAHGVIVMVQGKLIALLQRRFDSRSFPEWYFCYLINPHSAACVSDSREGAIKQALAEDKASCHYFGTVAEFGQAIVENKWG